MKVKAAIVAAVVAFALLDTPPALPNGPLDAKPLVVLPDRRVKIRADAVLELPYRAKRPSVVVCQRYRPYNNPKAQLRSLGCTPETWDHGRLNTRVLSRREVPCVPGTNIYWSEAYASWEVRGKWRWYEQSARDRSPDLIATCGR